MVDYSKWDAMVVSETESESGDEESGARFVGDATAGRGPGGVYKVTPGEDLHIPGRNVILKHSNAHHADPTASGITEIDVSEEVTSAVTSGAAVRTETIEAWTTDGAVRDRYAWCQDADSVIISVFLPPGASSRDVNVSVKGTSLRVTHKGTVVLAGSLFSAVVQPEDEGDLDWELKDMPGDAMHRRCLRVSLDKQPVLNGAAVLWWKSALTGEAEIDTARLQGRSKKQQAASATFAENFSKAKEMFREKMRNRVDTRVEVDIDS